MEHYIINQKKINIERNKEFLFKIPIRINLLDSTIIIENSNKSSEEEIIVSFYLKNLKTDLESKEIILSTEPFSRSYSIRPNNEKNEGDFLLYACSANKQANIEVSIIAN